MEAIKVIDTAFESSFATVECFIGSCISAIKSREESAFVAILNNCSSENLKATNVFRKLEELKRSHKAMREVAKLRDPSLFLGDPTEEPKEKKFVSKKNPGVNLKSA